jgi:enoyl-CoA hydratase/carnithine racemase
MSGDIHIRTEGRAGRITLTRPRSLNALSWEMCLQIEAALDAWREDDTVALVLIDADGDKAFCAGGDVQQLYETGRAGDYVFGRRFWSDEYRLNATIAGYPKPYVALMQGFVMGGGVGISCHGSHRIVCDSTRIAMPECSIGLVPDVGGSLLLARAPGRLGEYLGTTGARMGPGDAIHCGFADAYVPQNAWGDLTESLVETGDAGMIARHASPAPEADLRRHAARIDTLFDANGLRGIIGSLQDESDDFDRDTLGAMQRNSPLSMACAIAMIRRLRDDAADIHAALGLEYRFTYRSMDQGDFLEGVRAAIIDKDRKPAWRHELETLQDQAVTAMLAPLGADALSFDEETAT